MNTPSEIITRLRNLINQANSYTGKNATDITTAVQDLITGYGIVIEEPPENPNNPDLE